MREEASRVRARDEAAAALAAAQAALGAARQQRRPLGPAVTSLGARNPCCGSVRDGGRL